MLTINLQAPIESRGRITIGYMALFDCVPIANDEHNTMESLERRPNESVPELLERPDGTIEIVYEYDQIIDEVNQPR